MIACEACGAELSDDPKVVAEAKAEAHATFIGIADAPEADKGVLCDDCYRQFVAWMTERYGPPPWAHIPDSFN